jgi:hypothetical protein
MDQEFIMTPQHLINLRKAMGFKYRAAFATMLGVGRTTLEHWEYGRRQIPAYVLILLGYILDKHFPQCDGYLEKWKQILKQEWIDETTNAPGGKP